MVETVLNGKDSTGESGEIGRKNDSLLVDSPDPLSGTTAQRPAAALDDEGTQYANSTTSQVEQVNHGAWVKAPVISGGAPHVTEPNWITKIHSGGGYDYLCEAIEDGSALSDAVWRITRFGPTSTDYYAKDFTAAATDLATVAAYSYNGGVDIT